MVFAPHPDDELLFAGGVIQQAIRSGDDIRVVIVTNGDAFGVKRGKIGCEESVNALAMFGLNSHRVVFLGYGDQLVLRLFQNPDANQVMKSDAKATATYNWYGFGNTDYHSARFGAPAPYTRANILGDMVSLLRDHAPDEIYTVIPADSHPDHSGTSFFVSEAIAALQKERVYKPLLRRSIVHVPGEDLKWPTGGIDQYTTPFPRPQFTVTSTEWRWEDTVHYWVPDPVLKGNAIKAHKSKMKHDTYLRQFARSDEFFWESRP